MRPPCGNSGGKKEKQGEKRAEEDKYKKALIKRQ